jgi:prefoldin subunit 1
MCLQLIELQEQHNAYTRDLRGVQAKIGSTQRSRRVNQVTREQIDALPQDVPTYRSVGKAFFLTPRGEVESRLEKELETLTKNERDLVDRKEYLERRINSNTQNMKDLTAGM